MSNGMSRINSTQTYILFLSFLVITFGQENPSFTSTPQASVSPQGVTVTLRCRITNLGYHSVSWYFVEHNNLHISHNTDILSHGSVTKYSIKRDPVTSWDLMISDVQDADQGHYKCSIPALNLHQTSSLTISGNGRTPIPDNIPHTNYTDCCKNAGVSPTCLPPCDPATAIFDESFDAGTMCATSDLVPLLQCGADGRNHAPCCYRRDLPEHCIPFCSNTLDAQLLSILAEDDNFNECLDRAAEIIECFEEGQLYLPGPPTSVIALPINSKSVQLKWSPPNENSQLVTNYRVFYKKHQDDRYIHSDLLDRGTSMHTIYNLQPLTEYIAYVIAIGVHGSSLHSAMQMFITDTDQAGLQESNHVADCCREQGVSDECTASMCQPTPATAEDHRRCLGEYHQIFPCYANRRNHTSCCIRRSVLPDCYPLCAGSMTEQESEHKLTACLTRYIDDVVACFDEGLDIIPGPVRHLAVTQVTAQYATLTYSAPTESQQLVKSYIVYYTHQDGSGHTIEEKVNAATELSVNLINLLPNTIYSVHVISVGDVSTSLPSTTVIFRTLYPNGQVVPNLPPTPPVRPVQSEDVRECCVQNDVPDACLAMCSYSADLSAIGLNFECVNHIAMMLMCGADGVNHTECCVHEGVNSQCLPFCALDYETAVAFEISLTEHSICLLDLNDIRNCMQQGVSQRPQPPTNFELIGKTNNSITVLWQPPTNVDPSAITGYLLQYKLKSAITDNQDANPWKLVDIPNTQLGYRMTGLVSDKEYLVRVSTKSSGANSLSSYVLDVRTQPGLHDPPTFLDSFNISSTKNITDCCREEEVSDNCMPVCSGTVTNSHNCSRDIGSILHCVGGQRNHTVCCSRFNVPDLCLPLCAWSEGTLNDQLQSITCLSHVEQILTCMESGHENLPSEPLKLYTSSIKTNSIVVNWDRPLKNPENIHYNLYYSYTKDDKTIREAAYNLVNTSHKLEKLLPNILYSIYVIAINEHGSSAPSDIINVRTNRAMKPVVAVSQRPSGIVDIDSMVVLNCNADTDSQIAEEYWQHPVIGRIENSSFLIRRVTSDHVGRWTCHVKINSESYSDGFADLILRIRDNITLSTTPIVKAFLYSPIVLYCNFTGYPIDLKWIKDGKVLNTNSPDLGFIGEVREYQDKGILQSSLTFYAIREDHYGKYKCIGSNDFDSKEAEIEVISSDEVVHVPTVHNVTECCINKKVKQQCMGACVFDIDLTFLQEGKNLEECNGQLDEMLQCLTNGVDNSRCCTLRDVPYDCLPYCYGRRPDEEKVLTCLKHAEGIADCMENGHLSVPSVPLSVHVTVDDDGYLLVTWSAPKYNPGKVQSYLVNYNSDFPSDDHITVKAPAQSAKLGGIHSNAIYTVTVVAVNHHGRSQPSKASTAKTTEFRPSAPRNLEGQLLNYVYINLTWDKPFSHPGGVVNYLIMYKQAELDSTETHVAYTERSRLDNLSEGKKYHIYVIARSTLYSSPKSNIITIQTTYDPSDGGSNKGAIIGVAVFFSILILTALVGLGLFYYLRFHKPGRPLFSDAVAFENPSYATRQADPQVTGLPSYTGGDSSNSGAAGADSNQNKIEGASEPVYETIGVASNNKKEEIGENNDFNYKTLHADPSSVELSVDNVESTY